MSTWPSCNVSFVPMDHESEVTPDEHVAELQRAIKLAQ